LLHPGVCAGGAWLLRRDPALERQGLRGGPARGLQGPVPARSAAGAGDDGADVLDRRRAAAGRLLGEAADLSGAVGKRPPVAGGHRGRHVGGGRVLLPAGDQAHVLRRADAAAAAGAGSGGRAPGAGTECRLRAAAGSAARAAARPVRAADPLTGAGSTWSARAARTVRKTKEQSDDTQVPTRVAWVPGVRGRAGAGTARDPRAGQPALSRSEEHTSELQSRGHLVCRLLLE